MDMLKDERFDFTILENDIVRNTEKYSKNELLAYIAISFHADKAGTCFPSYEGIARIMRASRTTAINAVQGLVEKGVIKLENRKSDEKKKELTSNLYTLVSNKFWEQVQAENRLYLIKKGADYKKRYTKGKATKIANQNVKLKEELENGKKNTPDSTAIETDVNSLNNSSKNSFVNTIVPQETKDCNDSHKEISTKKEQNMSDALKQRLDLLKDAGIKYVPYKSEPKVIESLELDILKRAIDITVEQSASRSWKYLLPTYDSEFIKSKRAKENQQNETQTKFVPSHKPRYQSTLKGGIGMCKMMIGGKELFDYDADELERMVQQKQAEKWGIKPVY